MPRTQITDQEAEEPNEANSITPDMTGLVLPPVKSYRNPHNLKMYVHDLIDKAGFPPTADPTMWDSYARTFLKFPDLAALGQFIKDARERYYHLGGQNPKREKLPY